jgi:hypothetical protein
MGEQDDHEADCETHDVGPVAEGSAGIASTDRVGHEHEQRGVHERCCHRHDGPPVLRDSNGEQGETREHHQRAQCPELLARVVRLPEIWTQNDVADPLGEVDDQLLASGVVDLLE